MQHICVCIATFRRKALLEKLLISLQTLNTNGLFTYSVVIAGSTHDTESGSLVASITPSSPIKISYITRDEHDIVSGRNACLNAACGDYIAFIDDDTYPDPDWLLYLHQEITSKDIAAVGGKTLAYFDDIPSASTKTLSDLSCGARSKFYNDFMPSTNNCLIKRAIVTENHYSFNPLFSLSGGEDSEFFTRMKQDGLKLSFTDKAIVYEYFPRKRRKLSWYFLRFYRFGYTYARLQAAKNSMHYILIATKIFLILFSGILLLPAIILHIILDQKQLWVYFYRVACFLGNIGFLLNLNYVEYKKS
jgi:succinoglycan biosynthesis protein ExoM